MVLEPSCEMFLVTRSRAPWPRETIETTEAMPMMMPSMVRKLRSRCEVMAVAAMRPASRKRSAKARQETLAWVSTKAALSPLRPAPVAVTRSAMISPSFSSTMRWAWLATSMSWVTRMTVCPWAFSSSRMRSISAPLRESSAPVGSSARITSPPLISARAMDTRCCWPPDSSLGWWSSRSARPSWLRSARARVRRSPRSRPA